MKRTAQDEASAEESNISPTDEDSVRPMSWTRAPMKILLAVHRRLLPNRRDVGWTPYLWLFYISFSVWRWAINPPSTSIFVFGVLSLIFFLAVYFNGYWRKGLEVLWNIAALVALGVLWTPFDGVGMVFYIYGSGFAGVAGSPRVGRRVLLGIALVALIAGLVSGQSIWWTVLTICICGVVGATNIYFAEISRQGELLRRNQEENERLATIAERERISRDLHDLLGHTLSLITLKAELARKLSERGDERAAQEIAEVEQISREALRQVREAVEGYREAGLAGELARARLVCEARGVQLKSELASIELETRQEAALAMVLRESVTNMARHSKATQCHISLEEESSEVVLKIHDNGGGGERQTSQNSDDVGFGLAGMRERLRELGGHLLVDRSNGWLVEARIPQAVKERILPAKATRGLEGALQLASEEGRS